ncbi:Acetoin:2,6-dichlorophenolindophenol oxidoreductase subunit alpha [Pigmentiphaga humi]|uniref:Acetoin:2,6-dichlorophenolindophenol oxidoreductase subunit alpha n=1 Tax=Pigmentiphaga humi TaxID=2478468 RepID=A0A3P4B2G4_9BURK|nr:thiamine pyrophosphate-dependent enzyme [Pigmentiphaga humi]VCU69355.1 Acetoin:2,6-dichlorophenolindophenol oxidoreductase subunit alpha [Pigmentiphaga humi]
MSSTPAPALTPEQLRDVYSRMVLIREFEEQVRRLATSGTVPGLAHLCAGQEATAVGACYFLNDDDYIASSHRGHGHCLAKGMRPDRLLAEILGKRDGYCGGRSGSMHVSDPSTGNLGTNGIVGGGISLAAGAALAARHAGGNRVAMCFFGDGALNQGIAFEVMNMASIWKLPVIFVCENNGYGEYTALEDVTAGKSLPARGEVFDIPSDILDGMDVLTVLDAAHRAIARARRGDGPSFLIFNTYRYGGHHVGDKQAYKDDDEVKQWQARDPILKLQRLLLEQQAATEEELDALRQEASRRVREAADFAKASPEPDANQLSRFVYA